MSAPDRIEECTEAEAALWGWFNRISIQRLGRETTEEFCLRRASTELTALRIRIAHEEHRRATLAAGCRMSLE